MARILVVAAEAAVLGVLREALEACGGGACSAATGAEAIALLRAEPFDAAFIDVGLPDMTVPDLVRVIQELDRVPEVIVMTAQAREAPVPLADRGPVPRLEDVERSLILKALAAYGDDKDAAAAALGISRRTIYRRLKAYGQRGAAPAGPR
jgi:DNA-binding NtrC family response regulator